MEQNVKKTVQKAVSLILAVVLILLAAPVNIQAAEKPYMKTLNVKWDLEPNQEIIYQSNWAGLGYRKAIVKIKNYKITKAKKKGYKKLKFTVAFKKVKGETDFSTSETDTIIQAVTNSGYDTVGGAFHCTLVDLATGKCLERENGRDVTVKFSDWDLTKRKTYKGSDGSWIKRYGMAKVHVSVVYPADYKGLCIAAGGCTQREFQNPSFNRAFYSGNKKFGKTSYVSILNRKVTHVMRVK